MGMIPVPGFGALNTDHADHYSEAEYFNGSNHVSRATDSEWDHEALYVERGQTGVCVLHSWSQRQGTPDRYREISQTDAATWLAANGHDEAAAEMCARIKANTGRNPHAVNGQGVPIPAYVLAEVKRRIARHLTGLEDEHLVGAVETVISEALEDASL